MAYNEHLASRMRRVVADRRDFTERQMFGGLAFLCNGRMCCGIVGNDLMVRVPLDEFDAALRKPHVRSMDFTGKPLKGFVYVSAPGFATAAMLRGWMTRGERAAQTARAAGTRERSRPKTR